ncbi:OmpA family protein [Nesterenkonia xinjiangensis]|uniref:Outer membrane protein OmpA-like peptidoglycan-associated protein n=1 Tax=Nesterenkonia xinjiangensis TaxID=225327 RepID=A0A7Z0GKI0_9MICC|nr:OmpA family protein [Nesterenkonia xinjiangensis]NYJ77408.1 outer membrane protein OmpA-like peptidoglycan-associated protein [Nesterenkonia xinjiangensis]
MLVAEVGDPIDIEGCEPGEGRTVTMLEDVVVEEVEHDPVPSQTLDVDGQEVEIPGAPGVLIPERVGQAGCLVAHAAPGACLPRVELSAAYVPAVTLPERVLPEVRLPDGTVLEEVVQPAVEMPAIEIEGVVADEVCQADEDDLEPGDHVWAAYRWSEHRWSEHQWAETQWSETRWGSSGDGWSSPTMTLPTVTAETLSIPTVSIPTEKLETYRLDDAEHTERTEGEEQVSYITEGDVLFDPDDHEVRAGAEADLEAIASEIADRDDDYVVRVEGHTDDVATVDHEDNQRLSELRAESVVDWLADHGSMDPDLMSAQGFGEDVPRADNGTEGGRAENRRVVITVEPADRGEDDVDHEVGEEGEEDVGEG